MWEQTAAQTSEQVPKIYLSKSSDHDQLMDDKVTLQDVKLKSELGVEEG